MFLLFFSPKKISILLYFIYMLFTCLHLPFHTYEFIFFLSLCLTAECSGGYFHCTSADICIPEHFICDSFNDCPGGEDEVHCCKDLKFSYHNHSVLYECPKQQRVTLGSEVIIHYVIH